MAESGFVKVAEVNALPPGEMMAVESGGEQVLLVNVEGNVYACEDICSHAFASLSEGDLNGVEVECPLHGSAFNVTTGEALSPPAFDSIKTYQLRIEDGSILLGPPNS